MNRRKLRTATKKSISKYIWLAVLLFVFVVLVANSPIFALDTVYDAGGSGTGPKIICDFPSEIIEGNSYTLTCSFNYTPDYVLNGSGERVTNPANPENRTEAIYNFTLESISNTSHSNCTSSRVVGFAGTDLVGGSTTTSSLSLTFSPITVSSSIDCAYRVFVRTNLTGSSNYNTTGAYFSINGTSRIIDQETGLAVDANASIVNSSTGITTGPNIIILNSRNVKFTSTSLASGCRYRLLGTPGSYEETGNYSYNNATTACLDSDEYNCGDLTVSDTSEPTVFTKLLLPFGYSVSNPAGIDISEAKYGFYCKSSTGIMYGYTTLFLTIDTTPPNVTVDANSLPILNFRDSSGNAYTSASGTYVYTLSSRNITMSFTTNENATCKYEMINSSTPTTVYNSMGNLISSTYDFSHVTNITPPIGLYRYFHFACADPYGNNDNETNKIQPFMSATQPVMFLMSNPQCEYMNVNASDYPNDNGGKIVISWNATDRDAVGADNYVNQYAIFRVNATHPSVPSGFTVTDLFTAATSSVVNIANVTATDAISYNYTDSTTTDRTNYYYYVVPRYYNNSAGQMANILYNMSCISEGKLANSSDQDYPAAITNLNSTLAMNNIEGTTLRLNWTLSSDDGNNSNDVTNYIVWRQIYDTASYTASIYDNISNLTRGTNQYSDSGLSPYKTYCYFIQTWDNTGYSTNSTEICVEPNSRSYFVNTSITPILARTNDTLTCTALIADIDGDDLRGNVNISWTIFHVSTFETTVVNYIAACTMPANGTFQWYSFENYTTECISNLTQDYFNKGDKVWCRVTASDGVETAKNLTDNSTYSEALRYINNSAPYASNVEVVAFYSDGSVMPAPNGSSNLYCNYTFNDVDSDAENTTMGIFEWYINNEGLNTYVKVLEQGSQTLSNIFIDQNDLVKCAVKPRDIDASWLNNPLQATSFANSSAVLIEDNSIPQIVNYSTSPNVTLVGNNVTFSVEWLDVDVGETGQMFVCDEFGSPENQAGDTLENWTHFGDNTADSAVTTTFYTNQSGRYVSKISIKPMKMERNSYFIYPASSLVQAGDSDRNGILYSNFSAELSFVDSDLSGVYTAGETIVNDTNANSIYDASTDLVIRGTVPSNLATLTNLSLNIHHSYYDYDGSGSYNASKDFIYYDTATGAVTVATSDRRLELVPFDNSSIDYTKPIYDLYVYEVDYPGQSVTGKTLIAQDNNNIFVLGTYNHFHPQYNAQPLPSKILAFVFCIDVDDDKTCDSVINGKNDTVYVRAETTGTYMVNDSSYSLARYDPEIIINYESTYNGGCLDKGFCNTTLDANRTISCQYTALDSDNDTLSYNVRVCDDQGACSVARAGSFLVNHAPEMIAVSIGSDSNTSAIGNTNNLACVHTGANDELIPRSDFVLDADANWTIFGDVRNHGDTGLVNGKILTLFENGQNVSIDSNSNEYRLAFDSTYYENGQKMVNNDTTFSPLVNAIILINSTTRTYYNSSAGDIVIFHPFNSNDTNKLVEGDNLTYINSTDTYLSYYDLDGDLLWDWNQEYPEDIVYNVGGTNLTNFDESITYTYMWYVKPSGLLDWYAATNFSWYDNDYNDILTHGNTMPGDQWKCQVTAQDQYGQSSAMNSSSVTIGYGGTNPSLAPRIYNITDNSNTSNPTPVGENMTVSVTYDDPDSTLVKAYMCNSSRIIRNSGCFEKEFSRAIFNGTPSNTIYTMTVNYTMESTYNNSPTSYTIMLCDPEYHCSDVYTSGLNFSANNKPYFTSTSPIILPQGIYYESAKPWNYSTDTSIVCNISFIDSDVGAETLYSISSAPASRYTWYKKALGDPSYSVAYSNLTFNTVAAGATTDGDSWICQAEAFDNYTASTGLKNSSAIVIGTVIYDTSPPGIDNVTTNSNVTSPINLGNPIQFTVTWHDYDSNGLLATIFICNDSRAIPSGCLGREISRYSTASSPAVLTYTTSAADLQYFEGTSADNYSLNYSLFVVDNAGNMENFTESNYSRDYDNFSINHLPLVSNVTVINNTYLSCSYTFSDSDTSGDYRSQYSSNNSIITWFNKTDASTWTAFNYSVYNNNIPSFLQNSNDTWICQVTPYDGYAYGTAINSSSYMVGSRIPRIINYTILSRNSPEFEVTASSPVTFGNNITLRVNWADSDDTSTTLYVLNASDINIATVYAQNTSSTSPIEATFSSLLFANATSYDNNSILTSNFTFALSDGSNVTYNTASTTVYINRKPFILSVNVSKNTSGNYFECVAAAFDNDTYSAYNNTSINYSWYVKSGSTYTYYPDYNVTIIPLTIVGAYEEWICQAIPYDGFIAGNALNSSAISLGNHTPTFSSVSIYNSATSPVRIALNNFSNPVTYNDSVIFNITWDDLDLYMSGETIKMYVCENSSTRYGCTNGTTWCNASSSNGLASCTFQTSSLNMSKYNNSLGGFNYSIFIYDTAGNYSNSTGIVYTNQKPSATANVSPTNPTDNDYIQCDYAVSDLDVNNSYNAVYNSASPTPSISWYLDRSNSGTFIKTIYTQATITPDLTTHLDRWLCQVTPYDGYVNGTSVNSSNWVTIGNAVNYTDYPNITGVYLNSNNSTRVLIGEKAKWSINWSDAQQPNEYVKVFICNGTSIVNSTGCLNKSFVNQQFSNYTKATIINVEYTVQASDIYLVASGAANGNISSYIMLCDDSGLCSNTSGPYYFYINDKPNITDNNVSINVSGSGNVFCNFNVNTGSVSSSNSSSISWYKYNVTRKFCGDGYIDFDSGEQCEYNDLGAMTSCSSLGFSGGTISCNMTDCESWDTTHCTGGAGAYCGDDTVNNAWEQCDGTALGQYRNCSQIGSYTGGTLGCTVNCTYDISQCIGGTASLCGNDVLEYGEDCEDANGRILGTYQACRDIPGYLGGTLSCNAVTCTYDTSGCIDNADLYEDLMVYNATELSSYAYTPGDIIVCKAVPYDGYHYGDEVFSNLFYSGISTTPNITSVLAYTTSSPSVTIYNTPSAPVEYGSSISLNITWQDFDMYTPVGEIVRIMVCNQSGATYQGCLGKTLCYINSTSQSNVGCTFNTSNITLNSSNIGNLTYYIYIMDDSLRSSNKASYIYVNRLPNITYYNITPSVPINSSNLYCNYTLSDSDNASSYSSLINTTHAYLQWYYKRNNVWNAFFNGANETVVNYFTEVGDEWLCQITYGDEIANATPVNTSSVIIRNNNYNMSYPNITSVMINSSNPYYGTVTGYGVSSATLYNYDNTTNAGSNVKFTIDWSDVNQLENSSEYIKVYVCNDSTFINNSGCMNRTLAFVDFTNNDPVTAEYTTSENDNTTMQFYIFLCDDSLQCSNYFTYNFTVNHKPGNFTPSLTTYLNSSGRVFECDYENEYEYYNGSRDVNASGSRILNDDANASTVQYKWYSTVNGVYEELPLTTQSIALTADEKVKCAINLSDVYGMSSGYLNSSEMDVSLMPVLWNLSAKYHNSTYVISSSDLTLSLTNNDLTIIGYLPNDAVSNLSIASYHDYEEPSRSEVMGTAFNRSSSLRSNTTIAKSTSNGTAYILVNKVTSITENFAVGRYIEISNHNRTYFERYNITKAAFEVYDPSIPNLYRINITPALNTTVNPSDIVRVYNGSTAYYPFGWFNASINISNGSSYLHFRTNNSGTLGPTSVVKIFYDTASPTITLNFTNNSGYTPVLYFNISDDYYVNLSSLIVNISNGTGTNKHSIYHFSNNTEVNTSALIYTSSNSSRGTNISCNEVNISYYICNVTLSLSSINNTAESYNLNITVSDFINQNSWLNSSYGTGITLTSSQVLPNPVAFAKPSQNSTNLTFGLYANQTNISEIQYAVGTALYPNDGWNSTLNATNYSGGSGFTVGGFTSLTKFVDYNYNIYLDDNEAIINSTTLNISSSDPVYNVHRAGMGLKQNGSTKYFDANNNSKNESWEPVFTSDDLYINNTPTDTIYSSSSQPVLTLSLNTSSLNLTNNTVYRISVRYYNSTSSSWSNWTSTNPIVYKKAYESATFDNPSAVGVYDVDQYTGVSEVTGTLVDIAMNTNLSFEWNASVPKHTAAGEYILRYEYALGNEPWPYDGWNSVFAWRNASNSTLSYTITNTTIRQMLDTGEMYYLTVRSFSSFGLYSSNSSTNGIVYDDQTAPEITILSVGDDISSPWYITSSSTPRYVNISLNENVTECRFSRYRMPFNYILTKACTVNSSNNTYASCTLTEMDDSAIQQATDITFYISCLDENQNANQAVPVDGQYSTKEVKFTYDYPESPEMHAVTILVNSTSNASLQNRTYAFRNEYLYCNFTSYDNDTLSSVSSEVEYSWYKNRNLLPSFENSSAINLSKYTSTPGDEYNCSVRVKDSTGRWSEPLNSSNIMINNSRPTAVVLTSPNGGYFKNEINFSWQHSSDVDPTDVLYYTVIIMNHSQIYGMEVLNHTLYTNAINISTPWLYNNYTLNLSWNGLADGIYNWTIETCDNSTATYTNGCVNATSNFTFTRDTTGPVVDILTPDNQSTIGASFTVIANIVDAYLSISSVNVTFYSDPAATIIAYNTSMNYSAVTKLAQASITWPNVTGSYLFVVSANDTLGNVNSFSRNISINTNHPILQIDWPPWVFREQYLNHSFNLNLTAYNFTIANYTITNASNPSQIVKNNSRQLPYKIASYAFTDPVDVSTLNDGKYNITFYAKDDFGNVETKTSWFAIDRTPPRNGTAYYNTSDVYDNATQTLTIEWFNNSLVADDNLFGVKNVSFYFINTTNSTPLEQSYLTATPTFQDERTYIVATSPIDISGSNYSYTLAGSYVETGKYIHWFSCAWDFAGNMKCSQTYSMTVTSRSPYRNDTIADITLYEDIGNDTILLTGNLSDPDTPSSLTYTAVTLPTGALLYDPLNSERYSKALLANTSGLNDDMFFSGLIDSTTNASVLIENTHVNLLLNPSFENTTSYYDTDNSTGVTYYVATAPIYWQLKNYAQYDNSGDSSTGANYTIYSGDKAGVNVTAKHYFYQDVRVNGSKNYTLSQWMRANNQGNITPIIGRLHVNWLDSNGNFISSTVNLTNSNTRPVISNSTWQRYNITVVSPSNAYTARVFADSDANESWVSIDNMQFEESSERTYFTRNSHTASYIRYPVQPSSSTRPHINASNGTMEITIKPLWGNKDNSTRYLIDASNTSSEQFKIYTDASEGIVFDYHGTKLNANIWNNTIVNFTSEGVYRLAFAWSMFNSTNVNLTAYLNGTLLNNISNTTTAPQLGTYIYLGSTSSSTSQINAFLDEFIVYDYAKNSTEIAKDNKTWPASNNTVDNDAKTLIFITSNDTYTSASGTFALINATQSLRSFVSTIEYDQRIQFLADDSFNIMSSNMINVHVITSRNRYFNVTVENSSGISNYSNNTGDTKVWIVDDSINNMTYSNINHSILTNTTSTYPFGIKYSTINYLTATDAVIVSSEVYYSTVATSTVTLGAYINNSVVSGSNITNSKSFNGNIFESNLSNVSTLRDSNVSDRVNLINSTLLNTSYISASATITTSTLNYVTASDSMTITDSSLTYVTATGSLLIGISSYNSSLYSTYAYTASIINSSNVSSSTINNSNVTSVSTIQNSILNISSSTNSTIQGTSTLFNSTTYNSTINQTSTLNSSNVSSSTVINSTLINSNVTIGSTVRNVVAINSTVTQGSELENVNLTNAFIDPSIVKEVNGSAFNITHSNVTYVYLNNTNITKSLNVTLSNIYNSDISNATYIYNSNITNCIINTTIYNTAIGTAYSNLTAINANLSNYSGSCKLISGIVQVNQSGTIFTYDTASYTAQALIRDIYNYTPQFNITDFYGSTLTSNGTLVGPNLTLNVSVTDFNLNTTIRDYVNVTWTVFYVDGFGNPNSADYTSNLQNSSFTISSGNMTGFQTSTSLVINITLIVIDKFGNRNNISVTNITYYNASSFGSPQCSDSIDNSDTEDALIDTADPGCHTDGNASNTSSYDSSDNDESNGAINCTSNSQCGSVFTIANCTNSSNGIYATYTITPTCNNASTTRSYCSNASTLTYNLTCSHICSNSTSPYCDYTQCSNNGDDDGDGLIDYPADPHCNNYNDTNEEYEVVSTGGGGGGGSTYPSYCSNNLYDSNYGETGIDCGGRCKTCDQLCYDGKLNGKEEGIDCGGVCYRTCTSSITGHATSSTCNNGKKDSREEGIDCGGPCTKKCATSTDPKDNVVVQKESCIDGIQNQGEEGIDCGGPCASCQQTSLPPEEDYTLMLLFIILFVVVILLISLGLLIISKKNEKKEYQRQKDLELRLEKDEQQIKEEELTIQQLKSGHSIADEANAGLYAKQPIASKGPVSDSIINLEKYIVASLDSGMSPSSIQKSVVDAGWDRSVFEVVISKIMLSSDKIDEIEHFISKQMAKGISDDSIKEKLAKAHWSREIVDLIIHDVHKISQNKVSLEGYIKSKLAEGKSLKDIHLMLVSIGWNEHYIERILGKFQE